MLRNRWPDQIRILGRIKSESLAGCGRNGHIVFGNLRKNLTDDGKLFGATILQGDAPRSGPAQALMDFYNAKGVFSNREDTLPALERALKDQFKTVRIEQFGTVATFEAQHE